MLQGLGPFFSACVPVFATTSLKELEPSDRRVIDKHCISNEAVVISDLEFVSAYLRRDYEAVLDRGQKLTTPSRNIPHYLGEALRLFKPPLILETAF